MNFLTSLQPKSNAKKVLASASQLFFDFVNPQAFVPLFDPVNPQAIALGRAKTLADSRTRKRCGFTGSIMELIFSGFSGEMFVLVWHFLKAPLRNQRLVSKR
jgi:hypothetical protein